MPKSYFFSNYFTIFIYACGYLASWNPTLIRIIFLSLALMEKIQGISFRLTFRNESVLSGISVLLNFASKGAEVWRVWDATKQPDGTCWGDGGLFWSGVIFSRYVVFWREGFVSFRYIYIDSLWSWKQKEPTKMSVKSSSVPLFREAWP